MKTLQGQLSIGMVTCSQEDDYFSIELVDTDSNCTVVDIKLTPEQFALALGMRNQDCSFEYNDSGVVGKRREHKIVLVHVPLPGYEANKQQLLDALKPHEIDGWEGHVGDLQNGHRITRHYRKTSGDADDGYDANVLFIRYVDKESK